MKIVPKDWPVLTANRRRQKIDPKPAYQRGPVWSKSQQQLFIDSLLREFDIPKLYLRATDAEDYAWEVIDGQQRLRAIWSFYDNAFPVADDADDVDNISVAGLHYEDLHDEIQDTLDSYALDIVIVEDAADVEIEEMFIRLQNGGPLNSAEKRHAISGAMKDFIHFLADSHRLMTSSVAFQNARYSHDEVVAQMMLIERHGGPTSVRHPNLKHLYEQTGHSIPTLL